MFKISKFTTSNQFQITLKEAVVSLYMSTIMNVRKKPLVKLKNRNTRLDLSRKHL